MSILSLSLSLFIYIYIYIYITLYIVQPRIAYTCNLFVVSIYLDISKINIAMLKKLSVSTIIIINNNNKKKNHHHNKKISILIHVNNDRERKRRFGPGRFMVSEEIKTNPQKRIVYHPWD